ncbi:uncharacterized protein LOC114339038 [Diabrotica virgifera virgifera]|uniref:Uncharacterized protein LOC114339038 n=1 Tax=Diabrotica virgifera virgifera TaxID=50390 RepID=A0A6P7G8N7_DIAVI|nr:uncharacterized protein LOC114339038 [Diabrotica virgifera virgifera]
MKILYFILFSAVALEITEASSFVLYKPLNTLIKPIEYAKLKTHHTLNHIHKNTLQNILLKNLLDDKLDNSSMTVEDEDSNMTVEDQDSNKTVEDDKDSDVTIEDEDSNETVENKDKKVELTDRLLEKLAKHVKKLSNATVPKQNAKDESSKLT